MTERKAWHFDLSGNLYVAGGLNFRVVKFDAFGNLLNPVQGCNGCTNPESLAFNGTGNLYIGRGIFFSSPPGVQFPGGINKLDPNGASVQNFYPTGTPDSLDLAADQCISIIRRVRAQP
jgi:hypothetical protein